MWGKLPDRAVICLGDRQSTLPVDARIPACGQNEQLTTFGTLRMISDSLVVIEVKAAGLRDC